MKISTKTLTLRAVTALMLFSLPFLGSDCEDVINQINDPSGDLSGNWTLIYNAGTQNDICPGEQVNFPANTGGTAELSCPPHSTSVTRTYTVSGTTLTYTETSIQYQIDFTQNNELVLSGNGRILYYTEGTIGDKKSK